MIVLGIDPGFSFTGFGVIKKEGNRAYLLDHGILRLSSKLSLSERIGLFYTFFIEKIKQWSIQAIALETPFLGKNAQVFLKLGYLRGIIYLLADIYKIAMHEFSPREVKLSVTGYGNAPKEQVARVVMRLFPGLNAPEKLDLTDAVAVTLCGAWKSKQYGAVI